MLYYCDHNNAFTYDRDAVVAIIMGRRVRICGVGGWGGDDEWKGIQHSDNSFPNSLDVA